jgi:hypothetical protein
MEELDVVFPRKPKLYFEIYASTSVNVPTTSTMLATNSKTHMQINNGQHWQNNKTFGRFRAEMP